MILAGSNGTGKTHTLNEWLRLVYEQARNKNKVASIWILARKNDSFCGLREANKLVIFNTLDPTEAFKLIEGVYKNFQARLKVVEEVDRANLPPLRLILEDWSSTVMILKKAHKTLWTKIELMLLDIITVGREYNVCLLILTHTIGLEALGLVVDSNLRANLTIVVQGLVKNELGRIRGDYLLIELAIKNQFIVPDNSLRSVYLTQVNELIPESRKKQVPIYFTTLGNGGVGMLPYIEKSNIDFTEREINESLIFNLSFEDTEEDFDIEVVEDESIVDSLERLYKLPSEEIDKSVRDNPLSDDINKLSEDSDEVLGHIPGELSESFWTVRKVREYYPNTSPEELFLSVSELALSGKTIRDIVRSVLKLTEGPNHPTKSYTNHGKTLLKWLIINYDFDDRLFSLSEIQKLFNN